MRLISSLLLVALVIVSMVGHTEVVDPQQKALHSTAVEDLEAADRESAPESASKEGAPVADNNASPLELARALSAVGEQKVSRYITTLTILIGIMALAAALLGIAVYGAVVVRLNRIARGTVRELSELAGTRIRVRIYTILSFEFWRQYSGAKIVGPPGEYERDLHTAIDFAERAIEVCRELDATDEKNSQQIAHAKNNLAYHLAERGRITDESLALGYARDARDAAVKSKDKFPNWFEVVESHAYVGAAFATIACDDEKFRIAFKEARCLYEHEAVATAEWRERMRAKWEELEAGFTSKCHPPVIVGGDKDVA